MKDLKSAIMLFIIVTFVCGGIYPAVVTGIAHALFPKQAGGSFVTDRNGRTVGSPLIGQPFSDPKYFWSRPSATADFGYNPSASGGSNLGPGNPVLRRQIAERVRLLRDSGVSGKIPADLVLASASGLDPHISPEAAIIQIPRVARSRGLKEDVLRKIVAGHTEDRQLGIFGERRVNVLMLNLALDEAGK